MAQKDLSDGGSVARKSASKESVNGRHCAPAVVRASSMAQGESACLYLGEVGASSRRLDTALSGFAAPSGLELQLRYGKGAGKPVFGGPMVEGQGHHFRGK